MCCGVRRCCYCNDSLADEVEHIFPKSIYPNKTFIWNNYLFCCGPCNGKKNNNFSIFDANTNEEIDLTPPNPKPVGYIPTTPIDGEPLFINPRMEDPFDYLALDILGTFLFVTNPQLQGDNKRRKAAFTIKILGLNLRHLPNARKMAFSNYLSRLSRYKTQKERGVSLDILGEIINELKTEQHPAVWAEMKRFHRNNPDICKEYLNELWEYFEAVPEALEW